MSDLVLVIKLETYNCPKTRTERKRLGGRFDVPVAEAVKGIEDGTYKAPGYSLGEIPSGWQAKPAPKKRKQKEEKELEE